MARDPIQFEIDSKAVLAALSSLQDRAENMTELMSDLAGILEDASERAFQKERDPTTGAPWAELSETTKQRRDDPLAKILQDSGSLVGSLDSEHDSKSAIVGFSEKYAAIQHFGATKGEFGTTSRGSAIPWGDIPARPILGLGDQDISEIDSVVQRYISSTF
jgi:phage virion morphogenesis protein